jgi:hypothetical protein
MLARDRCLRCLRASLFGDVPAREPEWRGSEVAGPRGTHPPPDPDPGSSARTWFQRRGRHRIQPKGIAMNDYEVICKGIVIIGSLQAVRS